MKKALILILVLVLALSAVACGQSGNTETGKTAEADADTPIDGGWGEGESIAVTKEVQAMFDKLNETMTGAYYVPVVYLSSQVVAGTNHKVLCKMIPSTANADALGTYVIVTVYEDLQGVAEITEVLYSGVAAPQPNNSDQPVAGGWSEPETYEVTDEAKTAVSKAFESDSSVQYEPVALLGTQVVAGMNYLVLCKPEPQTSGGSEYAILTVYADLQGGAEATDIAEFSENAGNSVTGADGDSASSQAE